MVELARALAQHPAVYRVDLLTRLIEDPKVDKSYSVPQECLLQSDGGELGGAYIVRLACGPRDTYLRSSCGEMLHPHHCCGSLLITMPDTTAGRRSCGRICGSLRTVASPTPNARWCS